MIYTAANIAAIIAPQTVVHNPAAAIEHLLTDSRKLISPVSTLFFALPGLQRNGTQYIIPLYKAGVRHFVVPEGTRIKLPEASFYVVPDVLQALQDLAAYHRQRFSIPVIGITGSNGKTIVKEWLYQLLQADHIIVRSPKSYNSQVGVPLSVWQMSEAQTIAIFEAGISKKGEMQALAKIIQPTIGVLTSIGDAHNEGFNSQSEKLAEKKKLFGDTEIIIGPAAILDGDTQNRFTWGTEPTATVQVIDKSITTNTVIQCRYKGGGLQFIIPFTDEASIENAITCCAVLLYLGYAAEEINQRLTTLHAIDMRLQLVHGINGCMLINDSYSADLTSLQLALHFLAQQKGAQKRTVILSDFVESGKAPEELYSAIAIALASNGIQKLITIGEESSRYLPLQLSGIDVSSFPDTDTFLQRFKASDFNSETILVKGARRFGFERIVAALETKVHQTVLQINLNALAHNLKAYRSLLRPGTKTMAMVKAFAYGSGSAEIANTLQFQGIDYLGVAYADEGIELRKGGITVPIMVMNTDEAGFPALVEYGLQPVLFSFDLLKQLESYIQRQGISAYPVHIELETGMHRLGFAEEEINNLAAILQASPWLKVQSVFSHLAASEDPAQDDFTAEQAERFTLAAERLQSQLAYPFLKHIANSAAILRHPQLQFDMVRLGIGLYGIEIATKQLELQPVATLRSTIAQLKHLRPGDTVSYNRRGVIKEDALIATVRIGYADGYSRRLGNGVGKMWVGGQLAPVVGTVCMDMTMLDVTAIPSVQEGDEVIVFGTELPVQQVADWCGTIPYEIMTSVSQRVKRVYFQE